MQERERAAMIAAAEEAERARLKAAKRAEADRKAGIDRRLVDMSAAEKRAIERREREKKEADKRRCVGVTPKAVGRGKMGLIGVEATPWHAPLPAWRVSGVIGQTPTRVNMRIC